MHRAEAQLTAGRQGKHAASRDTPRGGPQLPLGRSRRRRKEAHKALTHRREEKGGGKGQGANLGGTQNGGRVRRVLALEVNERKPNLHAQELGGHTDASEAMTDAKRPKRSNIRPLPFEG